MTLAEEAVTVVDHGVWKGWPMPPLGMGVGVPSSFQFSGGPRSTSGQGGTVLGAWWCHRCRQGGGCRWVG